MRTRARGLGVAMPASRRQSRYGQPWTRKELILAFDLYCRIPFRKTKASNPWVQQFAALVGRSPASVARKLGNFGAFDPQLQRENISGLTHTSRQDRQIWDEFHNDWNALVYAAYKIRHSMGAGLVEQETDLAQPRGASERLRPAKQRVHQSFFRQAVLSSYDWRCCITGIAVPECLVASHIIPWSRNEHRRADPTNGLCLSATFDRLFDVGLISISDKLTVQLSTTLKKTRDARTSALLSVYDSAPIMQPRRFLPALDAIRWHRQNVFLG